MTTETMVTPTITQADRPERIRVWDPLVRIFHWALVGGFATAFIVEDDLLGVHIWAGYLVLALIAVRLVWGLIGTRHARFSAFVRKPSEVLAYVRDALRLRAPRYLGHNPAGGAMVITLMIAVVLTGLSGLAVYGAEELSGPLAPMMSSLPGSWGHFFEEVHEVMANLTLVLIVAHVAGVIFSSLSHRENLIGGMITGLKRKDI
ncbi:MAG: cytochrome b/b6 domain-containing protein [Thiocapsa sp.]|uniref:cytochrome b/b6 domain-containing protein n=1 Tax=Thiocapsa sp. TaxID=2024551 RepID=UPI001BCE36B7|nr:cytochrome b/b6 domain-containing protein [Thiocapsa sp.]QVL47305.1 MAG: cytochrome b/b6 domain-containing protein [Thiocapsa sp.]